MQCLILVGGLGTRMSGFSRDLPKALLPVGTRTFLEWQLEWLASCGITEVILALGHQGGMIRSHLAHSPHRAKFPKLLYSEDGDRLLGTGGAIRKAATLLAEDFLVTYGDSFLFIDPKRLFERHREHGRAVTLSIYRNEGCFDRSNVEYSAGKIVLYDKRAGSSRMHHIDYGMFALRKSTFLEQTPGGSFDVADYLRTASIVDDVASFEVNQRFYEIGSPAGYESFSRFLEAMKYDLRSCKQLVVQAEHPPGLKPSHHSPRPLSVLVIIPGSVSYFYDVEGRRTAQTLERLGAYTEVVTLDQLPSRKHYDWVLFFNLTEIQLAFAKPEEEFLAAVEERKSRTSASALVLMESVRVTWFFENVAVFEKAQLDFIFDLGFFNQARFCRPEIAARYRFFFNGLTEEEKSRADEHVTPPEARPLRWAFVGHRTLERVRFAAELAQRFHPQGFLYLPDFTPITKDGPHLNEAQFEKVLRKTQLSIWCSHVPSYYVESIRFRYAFRNGSLPVKVNYHQRDDDYSAFDYLILDASDFSERLRELDFLTFRERLRADFLSQPSFEESLEDSIFLRIAPRVSQEAEYRGAIQ